MRVAGLCRVGGSGVEWSGVEWKRLRRGGEGQGFFFAREGREGGVCVVFVESKVIWYSWYCCCVNGNAKGYEKEYG